MPLKPAPKAPASKLNQPKAQSNDDLVHRRVQDVEQHNDGLPDEDTSQVVSMTSLGWMFVAPPGFGKSELFSLFPGNLMLACEAGHKFIVGKKLLIDCWKGSGEEVDADKNIHVSMEEAVNRIENSQRFTFITIDTIDALIKKCVDHHVEGANVGDLSDLGDYGKGFNIGQNDPIRKTLNRIFSSGRGMGIITHQEIKTNTFKKGVVKAKKETSLPNGIYKLLYPQMDIIIHGEFGEVREGQKHRDRIIKSEGDEDILAKNRGGILPPAWISPIDLDERREQMISFFQPDKIARAKAVQTAHEFYLSIYEE